jgi:O-antigen/teichoic acid export membrane protein
MNRQKELAKNTIILTVGKICTQFVSFMLLPLYTALLDPTEYGVVDLFNTYITLLVPIFNWQFENGLFRFMIERRKNFDEQKVLFSTVFTTNIFQALVYIVFYFVAQNFISSPYKMFLAIDVVLNIFLNTFLQFPRGLGKNGAYAVGSFISASTTVVMNVVLIAGLGMGAYGMFWATVTAKCMTIIYLVVSQKVWRYIDLRLFDKSLFKQVSKYSLPLIPNQLSWWVIGVSDRSIVSYVLGLAANGIYTVANKFSSVFITFYNIFNMSWQESVALHIDDSDRDEFLTDIINSMFRLFSSVCIGIIACMPFVFPYFINAKYADAYQQIPILMIAVLFQVVVGLYSVIYGAMKKTVEIAKTSFFAAVINIGSNILLINFIGLYAAAVSTLLSYMAMSIYRYIHIKKYVNVRLKAKTVLLTVLIGAIAVAAYYYDHLIINVLALLIVAAYAIISNRKFLLSTLDTVKSAVRKILKKENS